MSSAVISTSAALSRPFLFDAEPEPDVAFSAEAKKPVHGQASQEAVIASVYQSKIGNRSAIPLAPASHLEIRPAPDMAVSGIPALDALTGGLPRGCLTEICGPASSGRTSVILATLAAATCRGEFCALIDANDSLDPYSAYDAGIDLSRMLWVRCGDDIPQDSARRHTDTIGNKKRENSRYSEHRLEQVLRATDLLLESGGFGLIILDLADISPQSARRIPLTTWFRFRRAVEHKSTILLAIEQQPIAGSCSSLLLQLGEQKIPKQESNSRPSHAQMFSGLQISAELIRSRLDRKPSQSITFESKTAWAG
jgi:hypothetical protein